MKDVNKVWWILAAALLLNAGSALAGDAAAGKSKAAVCTACHGVEGKALIPAYPNLAGQNKQYLVTALKAYRSGDRKTGQAAMMAPQAKGLSDTDIENLAEYFSSLK
jgi:cytochrome c553